MLQGQEKSHSIIDSNAPSPFSSFSCHPLPGVGVDRMFLGETTKISPSLFISTLPQIAGSPFQSTQEAQQGMEDRWQWESRASLYTLLFCIISIY